MQENTGSTGDESRGDETFLDELFDRAVRARAMGATIDVDQALAARPHLRAEALEALALAADVAVGTEPRLPDPGLPSVAGFTILEEVGRGGMGVVYRARQETLGRIVALKVLRPSALLSERARERFQTEARALARIHDPHVVTIHEVFTSPEVCAYAMEWVDGATLAHAIDARDSHLDVPRVARLGAVVARALQAVHEAGLVHRDVKPSNILLRGDGVPVLSDFSLVHDAASDHHTMTGEFLGTLAYSAPEQLRGARAEVGPRSDVYALGVTLYAALARAAPFRSHSTAEMLRRIEQGVCAPLRRVAPSVPEDLANVIGMAMDPEPGRRYPTAAALADDLERFLRFEPVHARGAQLSTRLLRLVRRRPAVFTSVALALALAVGGPTVLYWQQRAALEREQDLRRDADDQRAVAEAANAKAQREVEIQRELTGFLREIFQRGDATQAQGRADVTLLAALDEASADLLAARRQFTPEVTYAIRSSLADLYIAMGHVDAAAAHLAAAEEARRAVYAEDSDEAASTAFALGRVYRELGRLEDAERMAEEAVRIRRVVLRRHAELPDRALKSNYLAQALATLGIVCRRLEKYPEAELAYEESLALYRETLGEVSENVGQLLGSLGMLQTVQGRYPEAETNLRQALATLIEFHRRHSGGRSHVDIAGIQVKLGHVLVRTGRVEEGEASMREGLASARALVGPTHGKSIDFGLDYAEHLRAVGRDAEAEPLLRELLAACESLGPLGSVRSLRCGTQLVELLLASGRPADAEALLRRGLETAPEACSAGGWLRLVGDAEARQGRFADAEASLLRAFDAVAGAAPSDRERRATVAALAELYGAWARVEPTPERTEAHTRWSALCGVDGVSSAH